MADFSSSELYAYDSTSDGMFFRFSVSPTSHDLDPYWFFMRYDDFGNLVPNNDYGITVKDFDDDYNENLNTQKNPPVYEVRIAAVKTPMIVSGWGYDIAGIAAPALGENRYFDPYTPIDRSRWKTGPLDIRWDDERKVWTAGAEVIEGILDDDIEGTDDPTSPTSGRGIIYRGYGWKYGDTYSYAPNPNPLTAIRPNPLGGDPNINAGDGSERQEKIALINRSKASFSKGDYFLAVKINYEWRIISGGGSGSGKAKTGSILLILGDYDEYRKNKKCVSFDPCMKDNGFGTKIPCAPSYAWASYDICGCKYKKVTDIRSYGEWAHQIAYQNGSKGWAAAFYGGSLKADDAGASCKGVRFMNAGGGLPPPCECDDRIKKLKCIKIEFEIQSRPSDDAIEKLKSEGCFGAIDTYDRHGLWGTTISYNLIGGGGLGGECGWGDQGTASYDFGTDIQFSNILDPNECYFGPDEYDPCAGCIDVGKYSLTQYGPQITTCGKKFYADANIPFSSMLRLAENCTKTTPTPVTIYPEVTKYCKCSFFVPGSMKLSCCST